MSLGFLTLCGCEWVKSVWESGCLAKGCMAEMCWLQQTIEFSLGLEDGQKDCPECVVTLWKTLALHNSMQTKLALGSAAIHCKVPNSELS